MNQFFKPGRFILVSLIFLSSCISNKKHLEQITALNQDFYRELDALNSKLSIANHQIDSLRIALAEKRGANEALTAMQDKLMFRIEELEDELETTTEKAQNRSATLSQELQKREALIQTKEKAISDLKEWINSNDASLAALALQLTDSLFVEDSLGLANINTEKSEIAITLSEELLFKSGATDLKTEALPTLEKIAAILNTQPDKVMFIVGHTDNQSTGNRNLKESLDFSAVRAARVMHSLIQDFGVAPNQLTLGARGEYAPRASNETPEGRTQNRRIELIISKNQASLLRDLKRRMDKL